MSKILSKSFFITLSIILISNDVHSKLPENISELVDDSAPAVVNIRKPNI